MKLKYINPVIFVKEIRLTEMIALSMYEESATEDDALSKSFSDFEDDDNSPKNDGFSVWED